MKVLLIDNVHCLFKENFIQWGWNVVDGQDWSYSEIALEIAKFDGVVIRSRIVLDAQILALATNLKFIGRPGAGLENIDLNFCKKKNISVFRSPEGNRDAVGEHVIGMLLLLLNKLNVADLQVRKGEWLREENRGHELKGKTVGIIGYGHMGRSVAEKLAGFGVEVVAYDKYVNGFSSEIVNEVSLSEIFLKTDILSLHTPLTDETVKMVDANFLRQFHKPIIFINSARGKSVVLKDLLNAIKNGNVIGACLDVLEIESHSFEAVDFSQDKQLSELLQNDNVVFSPHIAGWTFESKYKMAAIVVDKIKDSFLN
jgi:D-3-phosphoglycerate dehydrogenase